MRPIAPISALMLLFLATGLTGCSTLRDLRLKVADLEQSNQELRRSRDEFTSAYNTLKAEKELSDGISRQRIDELTRQIASMRGEYSEQIEELTRLKEQLETVMKSRLDERTARQLELTIQVQDLEKANSELEERYKALREETTAEIYELNNSLARLTEENTALSAQLAQVRDQAGQDRQNLEQQLAALGEGRQTLETQIADLTTARRAVADDLQQRDLELEKAQGEILLLTEQLTLARQRADDIAGSITENQQILAQRNQENAGAQALLQERLTEIETQQEKIIALTAELNLARQEAQEKTNELLRQTSELNDLKTRLGDFDSRTSISATAQNEFKRGMRTRLENLETVFRQEVSATAKVDEAQEWVTSTLAYINQRSDALPPEPTAEKLYESAFRILDEDIKRDVVSVTRDSRGVTIIVPADFLFRDLTVLRATATPVLQRIATVADQNPDYSILIEGHSNNVRIKDAPYYDNYTLSMQRALGVYRAMVEEVRPRVTPSRMRAVGCGIHQPLFDHSTVKGIEENKRIQFVFTRLY